MELPSINNYVILYFPHKESNHVYRNFEKGYLSESSESEADLRMSNPEKEKNNDEKDSTDMEAEPTPSNSIETVAETSVDAASSSQDSKPEDNEPTQVCLILH